jgi:endonuclease/exonuclease/phosphatase family metal-dependent hydrolase
LHHKKEDVRKEEWRTIMDDHNQAKLAATRKPLIAHIYAGDFNSLMRIDYDDATWAQIGQIRQQNRWEGCREEVTAMVTAAEGRLQDAKTPTTFRGNLSTCRFGTRIDYIFITDSLFKYCKRLVQVPTEEISDHNLVVCEINRPRK